MPASDKECEGRLQMEPHGTMNSGTSDIQEEGETSDSDSEFHDAVSEIHGLKDQDDHDTGPTRMKRIDDLEEAIDDSGFDEEEEHFELASEILEYDATKGGDTNKTSLKKDEKDIGSTKEEENNAPISQSATKSQKSKDRDRNLIINIQKFKDEFIL